MHQAVELFTPVVEIAGHHQGRPGGHMVGDEAGEALDLAHPARMDEAEMRHHRMNLGAVPVHRHVQQAALLESMVGHVMVANLADRPARQQGIAVLADRVYQLTWQNGIAFVYDARTSAAERTFRYTGEGWGLTTDGTHLILSDGTSALRFLDPETLSVGDDGVVYARARGGALDARFSRHAQSQLAPLLVEAEPPTLSVGGREVVLPPRSAR